MKKGLLLISLFLFTFNISYAQQFVSEYQEEIYYINQQVNELKRSISNLETTKTKIINDYQDALKELDSKKNIEKQQVAMAYNKLGLGFSSGITESMNNIDKKYLDLSLELENDINNLIKDLDLSINNLNLRINENQKLIDKNNALEQLEFINTTIEAYINLKDYKNTFVEIDKAIDISKKNNLWTSIEYYNKLRKKLEGDKELDDKIIAEKNIILEQQKKVEKQNELKKKAEPVFNNIKKQLSKSSKTKQFKTYNSLLAQLEKALPKLKGDKKEIVSHLIFLIREELKNY